METAPEDPAARGLWLQQSHSAQLRVPRGPQPPAPYLDVLSLQSRRLLSHSQAEIAARGAKQQSDDNASDADRLEELLASVRLLVEPLQIPDLSHTGVFHSSTSQLQVAESGGGHCATAARLALGTIDKETDVKLFYPTGAKKANMREYVKKTLQRHLASEAATALCTDLSHDASEQQRAGGASKRLETSASVPVFASHGASETASPSPKKTMSVATKAASPSLRHKLKPKAAACGSPLLNPELTRQAKDVIAAIRANSSKINELIGS